MEFISTKIKELKSEIQEIRIVQVGENETIENIFKREWLAQNRVFLYYDEKTIKIQEIEFLKFCKNIEISSL